MTLDSADAMAFDGTVSMMAATMGALGHPGSLGVRRANAVGILADPQRALDLLAVDTADPDGPDPDHDPAVCVAEDAMYAWPNPFVRPAGTNHRTCAVEAGEGGKGGDTKGWRDRKTKKERGEERQEEKRKRRRREGGEGGERGRGGEERREREGEGGGEGGRGGGEGEEGRGGGGGEGGRGREAGGPRPRAPAPRTPCVELITSKTSIARRVRRRDWR